ncbi:lysophospholipid transporter LplT [Ideonella sp. TBM-1]|uniref:Lysophospholipid transporter LplT n=1 Tax=Ideonella livida TaxID=2707176 RepID=A0A7C9TM41_9BURK|nr:lysophospholipid transporter LplT [Ideonella livida]
MPWLLATQGVSGLADQALLLVILGLLQAQGWPAWWAPLLKLAFNLAYVLGAPWTGRWADAVPKGGLMAAMNALKALGLLALLAGLHPLAACLVVGVGAAGYAPAKYGLVCELVPPARLVAANAWLEVTVVGAVLLGAGLGGGLISPGWAAGPLAQALQAAGLALAWPPAQTAALLPLLALYALAALLQRGVRESGAAAGRPAGPGAGDDPAVGPAPDPSAGALRTFRADAARLWRDPLGGLSLAVTTLFWGLGATLQLVVLHWSTGHLGLALHQAAWLQASVALGVVAGAWAAGRWVPLAAARHMLWAGVALGACMPVMAAVDRVVWALPLLLLTGAVGGLMVVPLNALLQHRGHQLLSAGRSVAVQGAFENASVLLMLAAYAGLLALEVPLPALMTGLGLAVSALLLALIAWDGARRRRLLRTSG